MTPPTWPPVQSTVGDQLDGDGRPLPPPDDDVDSLLDDLEG